MAKDLVPGDLVVARRVLATVAVNLDASASGGTVILTTTDGHSETFGLTDGIPVEIPNPTLTGS